VGGESGAGARPLNVEWIRSLVEQCEDACLPIFVKQLGKSPISTRKEDENWSALVTSPEYGFLFSDGKNGNNFESWPADLRVREWPE
jgi:hypothetical protein